MAGAQTVDQLPPITTLPEVAFAGRSNVGKSSLVNALTGRKTLARVSATPGRTQQINFFDLGERLMLVDLPGYGYAKVSRDRVDTWTDMIEQYLRGRPTLRRVCLLVDSRHGLKPPDIVAMRTTDRAAVPCRVILTKADKMTPDALRQCVTDVETQLKKHTSVFPDVHVTSSETALGINTLREDLAALALAGE